jgi:hypothetical protein
MKAGRPDTANLSEIRENVTRSDKSRWLVPGSRPIIDRLRAHSRNLFPSPATFRRSHNIHHSIYCPWRADNRMVHVRICRNHLLPLPFPPSGLGRLVYAVEGDVTMLSAAEMVVKRVHCSAPTLTVEVRDSLSRKIYPPSFFSRSAASISVSSFLQKQNRTCCEPRAGSL